MAEYKTQQPKFRQWHLQNSGIHSIVCCHPPPRWICSWLGEEKVLSHGAGTKLWCPRDTWWLVLVSLTREGRQQRHTMCPLCRHCIGQAESSPSKISTRNLLISWLVGFLNFFLVSERDNLNFQKSCSCPLLKTKRQKKQQDLEWKFDKQALSLFISCSLPFCS